MTKTLLETIGYRLGQKAAQAKNAFDLMGGTEEDSLKAEIRLGRDMTAALLERTPLINDNAHTKFAAQIGHWLAANLKEKKLPFTVYVTADPEPNALAVPGGAILVSWPLLQICQGERDEIAFVLGHEMAHIVLRHTLDRLVKDAAFSLLLRHSSGRHAAGVWLQQAGRQLLSRAFSRDDELEADAFAITLLRKAGADVQAPEHLFEKLARLSRVPQPGLPAYYLATHPPFEERLAYLREKCGDTARS